MVDFLSTVDAKERAKALSRILPDEAAWKAASSFAYASITGAFYDVAQERDYDADICREYLALNMLYHICNLAVESGLTKEEFLGVVEEGYDVSTEIASEQFKTSGNA